MTDYAEYLKKTDEELIRKFTDTWPGEVENIKIILDVRNAGKMANLTKWIAVMVGIQALTMVLQFVVPFFRQH